MINSILKCLYRCITLDHVLLNNNTLTLDKQKINNRAIEYFQQCAGIILSNIFIFDDWI